MGAGGSLSLPARPWARPGAERVGEKVSRCDAGSAQGLGLHLDHSPAPALAYFLRPVFSLVPASYTSLQETSRWSNYPESEW